MSTKQATDEALAVVRFVETCAGLEGIEGWLHPIEGFALMELARLGEGTGAAVEIGSFKGLSTCWLAIGAREGARGPVYAVDHFKGSPEHQAGEKFEVPEIVTAGSTFPTFESNLRRLGVWDVVRPIKSGSLEAAAAWKHGAIRLLFIDGDHSYEASKADFEAWSGLISPRGCVGFHDIGAWEGVTRYYGELVATSKSFRQVLTAGSLRVMQRMK
jgi:predicted O-methyltransferase YrrM